MRECFLYAISISEDLFVEGRKIELDHVDVIGIFLHHAICFGFYFSVERIRR
jgi:hypothetical protein